MPDQAAPSTVCPGCGDPVAPGAPGRAKVFCSDKCRQCFNNLAKAEGAPLAPLVKAWIATRHAKPGSAAADVRSFAMSELVNIAREFLERDQAEGRDTVAYVSHLARSGYRWVDRSRLPARNFRNRD